MKQKAIPLVLIVAILARLAMLVTYQVTPYSDTKSYRNLANVFLDWVQGGTRLHNGTRAPGYSLFLALTGSDQSAWLVQLGMGMVITLLFFYLGWKLSGRIWVGGAAALLHTLNLGQLFFESSLLTETLSTFWVILALAGLVWGADLAHKNTAQSWGRSPGALLLAGGVGLAVAGAVLTRPVFVYLPLWIALCLFWCWQPIAAWAGKNSLCSFWPALRRVFLPLVVLTIAVAVPVLSWVGYIYNTYGHLSLTVMSGYHLVQHTGVFFEYVPDEHAALRDTYIRYREAHIAEYGTQTNTIWGAIPELSEVTGLNFYDLSQKMADLSVDLIVAHPDLYARNLIKGWALFWLAPVYWESASLRWVGLQPVIKALILVERGLLVLANIVFIGTSLAALLVKRLRRAWQIPAELWALAGTVWLASFVQTMLDHGDNPRFLVPLQSVVVLWVVWWGSSWGAKQERQKIDDNG